MARITLRDYNNEINDLIDHGQIDEAISNCRHILKEFPKHVDTYRLLGKAYLEQQRFGDAADILQRVLSSIPDDFISQIGMSIIREDEMNLDAAIFHMELAFESQPSNHAIQDELRRLFAKRDGMEPPRIRLTRGALARMYAHGHLVEQAISEIQAALSEDPARYDLQTLLAEMLYQAGKKVDAAETCTRILEKLPFNLDANRLLAMILKESNRNEEAEKFQERWEALDPYAAFVDERFTSVDQVPDDSVTVEREDWQPVFGDADGEQPAWASSLGVSIDGEEQPEEIPDWLASPEEGFSTMPASEPDPLIESSESDWITQDTDSGESPFASSEDAEVTEDWMAEFAPPPAEPEDVLAGEWQAEFKPDQDQEAPEPSTDLVEEFQPESTGQPVSDETEIPEFLKEAGWGESTGELTEPPAFENGDEPIEQGEIPDWMKEMAPPEDAEPAAPDLGAFQDVKSEADPDWLKSVGEDQGAPTPDWLGELDDRVGDQPEHLEPVETAEKAAGYLAGEFGEDDTDDWLASLSQETPADQAEPVQEPEETAEKAAGYLAGEFGEDDTDDWLASLSPEEPADQAEPVQEPEETAEKAAGYLAGEFGEDDTDDWLASLSQETPAGQAELEQGPEETAEKAAGYLAGEFGEDDTDDWLASLSQEPPADQAEPEQEPEETAEKAAGYLAGEFGDDDTDDWLASLSAGGSETPPEELLETQHELETAGDDHITGAEPEPDLVESSLSEEDEGLAWLESLAKKQGVAEEELVTSPDARQAFDKEQPPSWLDQPETEEQTEARPDFSELIGEPEPATPPQPAPAPEAVLEDEDDLSMDWLDSISQEAAAEAAVDQAEAEETPLTEIIPETPESSLADLFADDQEDETTEWLTQLEGEPGGAEMIEKSQQDALVDLFATSSEETPAKEGEDNIFEDEDDFSLDWLDTISQEAASEAVQGADDLAEAVDEEEDSSEILFEADGGQDQESEEALDWLQQLSAKPEVEEPPAVDDLAARLGETEEPGEETPDISADWLDSIDQIDSEDLDSAETIQDAAPWEDIFESSTPEVETPPSTGKMDRDDEGLAWLESLAAKQGVAEEELVTSPEARSTFDEDRTPEWLKQMDETPESDAPASPPGDFDDLDALLDEVDQLEDEKSTEREESVFADDDDFSMDWLDSISEEAAAEAMESEEINAREDAADTGELSALLISEDKNGTGELSDFLAPEVEPDTGDLSEMFIEEELPTVIPPEPIEDEKQAGEETLKFEGVTEEDWLDDAEEITPEWMKIIQDEKSQPTDLYEGEPAPPAEAEADDLDVIDSQEEEELAVEQPIQTAAEKILEEEDDFSMDWLDTISQEAAAEAGADTEEILIEPYEEPSAGEDIPDWLSTIEDDEPQTIEELDDLGEVFGTEEEFPIEPQETESTPTVVPEWLQEIADEKPSAEPSADPEWLPEIMAKETEPEIKEEVDFASLADEPEPAAAEPLEEVPAVDLPATPEMPPSSETISTASQAIMDGDIAAAIKEFNKLIKKGKLLDDLIAEIKQALRWHPVNVELWQVLGDAYMKQNNLQDALDAYSKAEELLR